MRKIFLLITSLLLLFFLGGTLLAQGGELPSPGLTPDSPFYFLERISEWIGGFFTFGDLKKAERYAVLSAERVAEAQAVVEKGKPEFAEKTFQRYEMQLNKSLARAERAQVQGKSVKKVMEIVAEGTGKQLMVIEKVLEKVSEKAKEATVKAKEASITGQKNALRVLAKEDPERAMEINLKAAEARLIRAKVKAEEGETEEIKEAVHEFENQHRFGEEISQIAQGLGKDITTVEQLVGRATSIHLEVLAEVYERAPEPAKPAIERAMSVSAKGHERAVEVLKEKDALGEVPEEVPMPEIVPEEVKERIREGIVEGGPCFYDTFKGKCKTTSIINESTIKFKFTPTEPLSEKAKWVDLTREMEKYAGYLGLECLKNKYPITKEDLEKCGIKENAALDCELEVIISGTCTPIIFKFYESAIEPEGEKLDCPYECCIDEQYKTKTCSAGYECQENKCVEIICIGKGGETWAVEPNCCEGLKVISDCLPDEPCPISLRYCVDCGNGACEAHENWFNCSEDCSETAGDCEKIIDGAERDACYSNVARETKDSNLCEKITESSKKDTCYYIIATGATRGTKDTSLCGKITGSSKKDGCYYVIAVEIKDASICEKITDDTKKDNCYYFVAIEAKDASPCEKIINNNKKNSCYTDIAIETKDNSLCEKITDSFWKNSCYTAVGE